MTTDNATDMGQKIRSLLAKILNMDESELLPESRIEDLGADSLDIAELSSMLVEAGISLDKAQARQADTLADLVALARHR